MTLSLSGTFEEPEQPEKLEQPFQPVNTKEQTVEEFMITHKEDGKRLDVFLMEKKRWPRSFFMKALRTKKIKVNGKKEDPSYRLVAGDQVRSFVLEENQAPVKRKPVAVIYEDENFLAVNKPAGVLSLDVTGKTKDTMADRVTEYLKSQGGGKAYPVHRIDFNTSGILLFAKSPAVRDGLMAFIKERKISKSYVAVVLGVMQPAKGTLTHQLFKDAKKNQVYVTEEPVKGSRTAITEYERLAVKDGLSLVRCHLITGRTHQIRSQMAHVGHPLLGDDKYGSKVTNRQYKEKRQLLCACCVEFHVGKTSSPLAYLDGMKLELKQVDFVKKYFSGASI